VTNGSRWPTGRAAFGVITPVQEEGAGEVTSMRMKRRRRI
jgi:hypothetical protein